VGWNHLQERVLEIAVRPKILLVDDNASVRDTLRAVLELSQFDVKTAANVTDAIHLIDTEAFDVLLSG
jgi:DNA-binding NtrC family response regulator